MRSGSLTTDSAGELHVLWHNGDSLGVDGTEVGVLEKSNHVSLGGLLESEDSGALETEVVLVLSGNFTNESLEWELSDEEFSTLLESSDFTEGNSAWSESMGFLDSTGGGGLLGSSLVSDVLSWVLGASVFTGGLLCACHCIKFLLLIS